MRAIVAGIPNVGKSTFINTLAGGAKAKAGNKPGVTRGNQWVKILPYLELMDTPGLLCPKLDNQIFAANLAYIGCIKDDILDQEELVPNLLDKMHQLYPGAIEKRFGVNEDQVGMDVLSDISRKRGYILRGGEIDLERSYQAILDEFRAGKIGRMTLDVFNQEGK